MYRKIVWCYVFVLTLLDISLNTKLSAQGKSHGVTVHNSLIEGITFQEWGKESRAAPAPAEALALRPRELRFGRAALGAPAARAVTLTNTANATLHLASVAGTTPDFHASFFESKTLPPQANTTFTVVYLGRREGPVSAHLYIHTSLGVHKYPVSAFGVASEWGVWPLVGVRVPANATAEPLLTMFNPTDQNVQVTEVYSSAPWLRLQLPDGATAAPRERWLLPPRAARPLVRLHLQPPPHQQTLTAYIRIKAGMPGGGLVVCVEAARAPAGAFLAPWQLRVRAAGSADPPLQVDVEAGNSLDSALPLDAGVWRAECGAAPPAPPHPHPLHEPAAANGQADKTTANGNGASWAGAGGGAGVRVAPLRARLEPHQPLARAALLTLDYAAMWAAYTAGADGAGGAEAWCAGWVRLGGAALPYSVRLLRGTLRLLPERLHLVTANLEEALKQREIRVRNEFATPVHISHIERSADIDEHFECEWLTPLVVESGAEASVARLRLRAGAGAGAGAGPGAGGAALNASLLLHTNVTQYALPVYVYTGQLILEWEWPNSSDGELRLGAVGASSTRRVALRVRNPAPAPLCLAELRADLPGAQLALQACTHLRTVPDEHACRCIGAGESALAWLTVVAPAREGPLRGAVWLGAAPPGPGAAPPGPGAAPPGPGAAPPALTRAAVSLHAHRGRVHAHPLHLYRVAPYVESRAALVLESSMAPRMRVASVAQPPGLADPALRYIEPEEAEASEIGPGRHAVGTVLYAAEETCGAQCYTGLDIESEEGVAWLRRGASALGADAALQAARRGAYAARAQRAANISLYVHTTQVVQIPVSGTVSWWWPTLADGAGDAGDAGLGGVGDAAARRVAAANPARVAVLLQPVLAGPLPTPLSGVTESPKCKTEECVWSTESFKLVEWRATRGDVRLWDAGDEAEGHKGSEHAMPLLLLAPGAAVEIKLVFAPKEPLALTAFLYLRNNLTILEGIQLTGRGVYPSFELGGRRPNTNSPILFEVSECSNGVIRRSVTARNTGLVPLRLRGWQVAGQACGARGFRLQPCAPLQLAPNQSRALQLHYSPDLTLARVHATLHTRTHTGRATFTLAAVTPAKLLAKCSASAPRPPWEPALRAAGTLLALAALALVVAAAALDAERELRRARAARPPPAPAPRAPLDLRALGAPAPPPPAPPAPPARKPPPKRRRTPKPTLQPMDPHAERRAFERWRAEVLRQADEDDSRSSEDAEQDAETLSSQPPGAGTDEEPLLAAEEVEPCDRTSATDGYEADPETEDRPQGSGDEDAASTGSGTASASSSSSPTVDHDHDEIDEPEPENVAPASSNRTPPDSTPSADTVVQPADAGRAGRGRSDGPRRGERARADGEHAARARSANVKHHARKDKPAKRRERPPAEPPRSPPSTAVRARGRGAALGHLVELGGGAVGRRRGGRCRAGGSGGRGGPAGAHRLGRAAPLAAVPRPRPRPRRGGGPLAVLLQRGRGASRGLRVARAAARARHLHPALPRGGERGGRRLVPLGGLRVGLVAGARLVAVGRRGAGPGGPVRPRRARPAGRRAAPARLRRPGAARARLRPLPLAGRHLGARRARLGPRPGPGPGPGPRRPATQLNARPFATRYIRPFNICKWGVYFTHGSFCFWCACASYFHRQFFNQFLILP